MMQRKANKSMKNIRMLVLKQECASKSDVSRKKIESTKLAPIEIQRDSPKMFNTSQTSGLEAKSFLQTRNSVQMSISTSRLSQKH